MSELILVLNVKNVSVYNTV